MENLVNAAAQTSPSLWRGRKVFITGHTGFKGGWLSLWLTHLGAHVRGYSLAPPTTPNLFDAARIRTVLNKVDDLRGDIRNTSALDSALREFSPDVVFHLAAQPLVRRSYADPIATYSTNVIGTANLLESLRTVPSVRAAVIITTDKCYANREQQRGYIETDPLGGFDPYSSSKACAEILTASYRSSFFPPQKFADHQLAIASARAGNVLGGGDWSEDRLIPDLLRGFISGSPVRIRNPQAVRPWQHVLEPLAGYITLAEHLLRGEIHCADAWNFGPDNADAWPVHRIADEMSRLLNTSSMGNKAIWQADTSDQPHETACLKLDSSKARTQLHWQPRLNLPTALQWLTAWHQAHQANADMQAFTLDQIHAYENLPSPSHL